MSAASIGRPQQRKVAGGERYVELVKRLQQDERRLEEKRAREEKRGKQGTKSYTLSGIAGIAYRDVTLGRSAPTRSRVTLDAASYLLHRERARKNEAATLEAVPRLADVCLRVLASAYGEPGLLDALDPVRHRDSIPGLLDLIETAAQSDATGHERAKGALPFQTWLDVTSRCAYDTPTSRKTYRGLVVSDTAELGVLKELNQDAEPRYLLALSSASLAESKPPPPAFFLAYLDLSSATSFGDGDIYKLRDPLSHFLATLRLDGTAVTDGGLEWIARAARDKPQYQQLAILRLRGLRQVTDAAVVPLATHLPNLRALDVRGSGCTASVGTQINRAMAQDRQGTTRPRLSFFRRPAEVRKDVEKLPSTEATISVHIELELFDPSNFSPAHSIAILHYLGARERSETTPLSSFKPPGVDLTSLTRASTTNTSDTDNPKTAEQVYEAQIALQAKLSHATHHAMYGGLTSTVALSRDAIAESGSKEPGECSAAFRVRNDAIMGGKNGGAAPEGSLYAAGLRRVHLDGRGRWVPHDRDAYSDDETEANAEAAYITAETAAIEAKQRQDEESALFYRHRIVGQDSRGIKRRGERTFAIPPRDDGMLIRFMPYVPPWEHKDVESAATTVAGTQELARELQKRRQGDPRTSGPSTPALVKKRRRNENGPELFLTAGDGESHHTAFSSSPVPSPFCGPSSSASPRAKPASQTARSLFTPRSDPKNLVKTGKALPKRSSLAAFRR